MANTYAIASEDIAAEEFDGEFVVLDIVRGHYFSLASGTALIWQGLVDGHSSEALCSRLDATSPVRARIDAVVASFLEHGLFIAAAREAATPVEPIADALAAEGLTFEVEVFNDLADLLISDPVHDVDEEAGWPHKPAD